MTFIRNLALMIFAVAAVTACNSKNFKDAPVNQSGGTGGTDKGAPASISFADVKVILDRSCARCHAAGDEDDLSNYKSVMGYVVAGQSQRSRLFLTLQNNGGKMPKRAQPIPDQDAALIGNWIDQGAFEFLPGEGAQPPTPTPTQPPTPPVTTPRFSDVAAVFKAKCVMCHGDTTMTAGFSLEHYAAIVKNRRLVTPGSSVRSGLYASVSDDFMPPKRAVAAGRVQVLTPDEKATLKAWLDAGTPN